MHLETFRRTITEAGLNPYFLDMTNIREQCSWVHDDREKATEKAIDIIRSAVKRAIHLEELKPKSLEVKKKVLVIGGGIGGISASIEIVDQGFQVYLVEKSPSIGGHMAQLSKTFPTFDCSTCTLAPKMVYASQHPNIEILTLSELKAVSGSPGNYDVLLTKHPRYVNLEKCTACGKCAECTLECPVYDQTKDETLAPASRIRALRSLLKARYSPRALLFEPQKIDPDDIQRIVEPLFRGCTVCGRCMTVCPFHFDLLNIWEKARENVVNSGFGPTPTVQVKEVVETEKNVFKMPSSSRRDWLEYEEVEAPKKDKASTVYFVGGTTSYSGLLMPIAHAVTSILEAAGEDWMLLPDEWCCSSPLKFAGQTEKIRDFVLKNIRAIEATGAKQVVFNCPSCYRRFKEDYPKILGHELPFALKHIVELANEHVKVGRLHPAKLLEETVTYHDPCELTRLLGVCEEPRELLKQYAMRFVEMAENKIDGYCCGAGGLLKAIDAELSLSLSKKIVAQAEAAGAKIWTSSCPACKLNLDEAAMESDSDLQVLDVVELVAQQLGLLE